MDQLKNPNTAISACIVATLVAYAVYINSELKGMKSKNSLLEDNNSSNRKDIAAIKINQKDFESKFENMKTEIMNMKSEVNYLKKYIEKQDDIIESLKYDLELNDNKKLPNIKRNNFIKENKNETFAREPSRNSILQRQDRSGFENRNTRNSQNYERDSSREREKKTQMRMYDKTSFEDPDDSFLKRVTTN